MQVLSLTFNPFQENTYILFDETGEALIVDPGNHIHSEDALLFNIIEEKKLNVQAIVNTHNHLDHLYGVNVTRDKYNIPFYSPKGEHDFITQAPQYAALYGIKMEAIEMPYLDLPKSMQFGNTSLEMRSCPGHSPDGYCFVNHKSKVVISGDVLFQGSIGRTDLPGGNYEQLMQAITSQLMSLDDDYLVYPGHGNMTSIGEERQANPFILEYRANQN